MLEMLDGSRDYSSRLGEMKQRGIRGALWIGGWGMGIGRGEVLIGGGHGGLKTRW